MLHLAAMRNEQVPTGPASNKSQNAFAAASPSGSSNPRNPKDLAGPRYEERRTLESPSRQNHNDPEALDALLVVVFATLANCSHGASRDMYCAFEELTHILRRYVAAILAAWGVPSPWSMAEDVVNDLFVRLLALNLVKDYDEKRAPRRAFLLGVLRKVLSEAFRKQKPNRTVPLPEDMLDSTPYPDEVVAMRDI